MASNKTNDELRSKRINENCKKIWGADSDLDISIETDDWEYYYCYVKRADCPGDVLALSMGTGEDGAWAELDKTLCAMAGVEGVGHS